MAQNKMLAMILAGGRGTRGCPTLRLRQRHPDARSRAPARPRSGGAGDRGPPRPGSQPPQPHPGRPHVQDLRQRPGRPEHRPHQPGAHHGDPPPAPPRPR